MALEGPIIVIEDDPNDLDLIVNALKELKVANDTTTFTSAKEALSYLLTTKERPFVILCDIRMTEMNGLEFRDTINKNEFLKKKSIPFLFYTAMVSQHIIDEAYNMEVQGFFQKPASYEEMKKQLSDIINYWKQCLHPNKIE